MNQRLATLGKPKSFCKMEKIDEIRELVRRAWAKDSEFVIQFLIRKGILADQPKCVCTKDMKLVARNTSDKFSWRCPTYKCNTFRSVRVNSFFALSRLPLVTIILVIYHWAMQVTIKDTAGVLKLAESTLVTQFQNIRLACLKSFNRDHQRIGGENHIVEIDESLFIRVRILFYRKSWSMI